MIKDPPRKTQATNTGFDVVIVNDIPKVSVLVLWKADHNLVYLKFIHLEEA